MFDGVTFNLERLILEILDIDWSKPGNAWRKDCDIIPDYMPPRPGPNTRPSVVVKHVPSRAFLRHSKGPRQGHGWDIYGDDYQNPELALIALSEAPPPPEARLGVRFTLADPPAPAHAPGDADAPE